MALVLLLSSPVLSQAANVIRVSAPVAMAQPPVVVEPPVSESSHYRIFIERNNGDAYAQMAEVQLLNESGHDLFDLHTVITNQSSYYNSGYSADKLIDNLGGNNKWTSGGGQQNNSWVSFTLSSSVSVKALTIQNYPSTSESSRQPMDFRFESSNDGVSWTEVKRFSGQTNWLENEIRYFDLN